MNDQYKNEFFDLGSLASLDEEIAAQFAQPTLVDKVQEENDKQQAKKPSFWDEVKRDPIVYSILAISALFTGTLGIYMGLAPTLVTETNGMQYIHFNTDVGHVMMALVYLIAFIGVTEYMFAAGKRKYHVREESNRTQQNVMWAVMLIAGLSIVLTGISGGMVVASNIAFLSEFVDIPPAAQKWVVVSIPILLAVYTFLFTAYNLSSEAAKNERTMQEKRRKQKLDHRTRIEAIEQIAERHIQAAEIKVFMDLVLAGKLTRGEALAAIRAGKTLGQLEKDLGRDLNDDRRLGDGPVSPVLSRLPQAPATSDDLSSWTGGHNEHTYHPVNTTPQPQPLKIYRADPEYFRAKVDYILNGTVIKNGTTYRAVENEEGKYIIAPIDSSTGFGVVDRETLDFICTGFPDNGQTGDSFRVPASGKNGQNF